VDAFPLASIQGRGRHVETFIRIPLFLGDQLEDISAPRCFEIELRLKQRCDIPIFHDDQHGTAIVVAGRDDNAMKTDGALSGRSKGRRKRAGAAGISVTRLLIGMGLKNVVLCDPAGRDL
jgi:malate dehydrogenase (oxaloacetate-decarboxylating)